MAESYEQKNRFRWLHRNTFFEITPLAGYAFIHHAKRITEVVFWYIIIIAFTIITVINVTNAFDYYLKKPTKTGVRIAANTDSASMGNVSLILNISIGEFADIPFSPGSENISTLCVEDTTESETVKMTLINLVLTRLNDWNRISIDIRKSKEKNFQEFWEEMHHQYKERLNKYFMENERNKSLINDVFDELKTDNWDELLYVLKLLSTTTTGNEKDQLYKMMEVRSSHPSRASFNSSSPAFIENVLKFKSVTARQLFSAAVNILKNQLPINVEAKKTTSDNSKVIYPSPTYISDWKGLDGESEVDVLFSHCILSD